MEQSIWDAIADAPDDDGPRHVLADQLQSRGDPLGEFIALQCRQAALGIRFEPQAAHRLSELYRTWGPLFAARFFPQMGVDGFTMHRGLPAAVRSTAERWLSSPETKLPIVMLELSDVAPKHLAPLLARSDTRRLTSLGLRAADTEQWSLDEAEALGATDLPRLEHLGLFHTWRNHPAALSFCSSPAVRRLKSLALGHSLSSDPLRVLEALFSTAHELEEISIDDNLPISIANFLGKCRTVSFPDSFVRPQLAEALAHRVALYLPPHVASGPTSGGPRCGRWQSVAPLGVRSGLDASLAREETTGSSGLLLRMRSLTADLSSPLDWRSPDLAWVHADSCSLGPIDMGLTPQGEWLVMALASGERLDQLVEREERLPLSPAAHAAAWAPIARWTAAKKLTKAVPLSLVWAGPRGLSVQPFTGELHSRRRGPARYTRREFIELSPEALVDDALDEKNATWGLAMQVCLTLGVRVFGEAARTDHELLAWIHHGPPVELYGHGLPQRMRELLKAALNRDPSRRPTPQELADGLAVFDSAVARAELARLPDRKSDFERARDQTESWLEGSSVHDTAPLT